MSSNPYETPQAATADQPLNSLGSLSQSARGKQLNNARNLLLFVGILTVVINGIFLFMVEQQVRDLETQLATQGLQADHDALMTLNYLIRGASVAVGVLFIIFGMTVKAYPLPISIAALVVYVGCIAIFALIDPMTLLAGIIWKVVIVVCLIGAIRTALAYEREKQATTMGGMEYA